MTWKTEKSRTNKSKSWLFEKHNKIHKQLANLSFKKGEITNVRGKSHKRG